MRVTTSVQTGKYLRNSNSVLSRIANISNRINSQRSFDRVSESPTKGVRSLIIRRNLKKLEMYESNISAADEVFTSAETALMNVSTAVANETIPKFVSGLTDSKSGDDKKIIAQELRAAADEMVAELNTQIAERRLFGGTNNETLAFEIKNDKVYYNGIDVNSTVEQKWYDAGGNEVSEANGVSTAYFFNGEEITAEQANGTLASLFPSSTPIYVDIGLGIKYDNYGAILPLTAMDIAVNGAKAMGCGTDDDGHSRNMIQLVIDAAKSLEEDNGTEGRAILDKIHNAHQTVLVAVADIGTKSKALEYSLTRISADELNLLSSQNDAEAVDMTEELIDYEASYAAYNAILQMGSKVIPNSIFNFIQ